MGYKRYKTMIIQKWILLCRSCALRQPKLFVVLAFLILLTACSSVKVPQVGAPVPCQIQSVEQVEQAVIAGLSDQSWEVLSSSEHLIEAKKKNASAQAVVHIAYGYRGFSIEYFDSKEMGFDAESDKISTTYEKWVYRLMYAIEKVLKQEVQLLPPIKCSSLKDQYQED